MKKIKAGFVGFRCASYPREIIEKRSLEAKKAVEEKGIELIYTDPVSNFEEADRAKEELSQENFDLLIACVTSWIESPVAMTILKEFFHKPILLWGLGGYIEKGRLISPASQAATSALRWPLEAMGAKFKFIYDWPDSPMNIDKVENFAKAARAVRELSHSKVGMMGYADMGLYATMFDGVSLRGKIGVEVEVFDMLEVVQKMEKISQIEISNLVDKMRKEWTFEKLVKNETLERLARIYLALKEKIKEGNYEAISLKCVEGMKKYMNFPPCMILSMLADELPAICEDDALGAVTQLMLKYLTDQSAPYMEMYEFMKDRILIGVCGFVPFSVVDGPIRVSPYGGWGGLSAGAMNTSRVKTGSVTLARLSSRGDKYSMHIVTGKGVTPGKWEELGWEAPAPNFPSLEVRLDCPVEEFAQKILSQHYLLAYGDHREKIEDLCKILGIEII